VGSRPAQLLKWDAKLAEGTEEVLDVLLRKAKEGDARCIELYLQRVYPAPRRGTLIPCVEGFPELDGMTSVGAAMRRVVTEVAEGRTTVEEGTALADLLDRLREVIEATEVAEMVERIERARKEGTDEEGEY
jgi:hypothetical protein